MGLNHSPSAITSNLLLSLDFANKKNYNGSENLCTYSEFPTGSWASGNDAGGYSAIYTANTSGTIDPLGTNNAAKVIQNSTGYQRITLGVSTPNGVSALHSWSVYVKQGNSNICCIELSGGWTGGGRARFTFSTKTWTYDGSMNQNLGYLDVGNGWYRLSGNFTPGTTGGNIWLWPGSDINGASTGAYTYFWGMQIEKSSAVNSYVKTTSSAITRPTSLSSIGSPTQTFSIINPTTGYNSFDNGKFTFTRAATIGTKSTSGGAIQSTGTGNLTASNFLYNDHTWEVWFKINDVSPSSYDATEGASALCMYRGWHQGFYYNASNLIYYMVDWTSPIYGRNCCVWTLGTSGTQVVQGQWYQAVAVRNGNTFTPYLNGVPLGTGSTQTTLVTGIQTSDIITIGSTNSPLDYDWYSKSTVSNMKMYNRALSAAEVSQNFNALRGRFGL